MPREKEKKEKKKSKESKEKIGASLPKVMHAPRVMESSEVIIKII